MIQEPGLARDREREWTHNPAVGTGTHSRCRRRPHGTKGEATAHTDTWSVETQLLLTLDLDVFIHLFCQLFIDYLPFMQAGVVDRASRVGSYPPSPVELLVSSHSGWPGTVVLAMHCTNTPGKN